MVRLFTLTDFSMRQVRSTTDTSGVGTRKAMPVSLPLRTGMTLPTALAAPVVEGMMFWPAPRPRRHFLELGASTVFWVAVVACTVVMRPSTIPNLSLITWGNWININATKKEISTKNNSRVILYLGEGCKAVGGA